jgi:arylsulfatase A-like enzyme
VGGYQREGISPNPGVTDNAPLRGGKGMLYEGGVREPYIFRWPGKIAPGTQCAEPIIGVDLYPTFLELAGGKAPANQPLDGLSYTKLLFNGGKGKLDRDAIYWHFPGYLGIGNNWRTTPGTAMRSGDWRLQEYFEDGRIELYNLHDDLGQTNNLAAKIPEKTKELHDKMLAWRKELNAPMPTKNTEIDTTGTKKKRRKAASDDE